MTETHTQHQCQPRIPAFDHANHQNQGKRYTPSSQVLVTPSLHQKQKQRSRPTPTSSDTQSKNTRLYTTKLLNQYSTPVKKRKEVIQQR